ncbi:MAG: right-handed parallel beta-helix repeat-containing protein, partial [Lacipirellulaceae bacterium]
STSTRNNANDGFSAATPYDDFGDLAPYLPLMPGEKILLKAGDTFTEELNLRGKGTAGSLVELSSYGAGPNPVIRRQDLANDIGVIWNNASYARISNIDVEHSKMGIYLRYEWTDSGSRDVTIENSNFRDMTDPTLEPSDHNFEYAWSDAIFVGGQAWNDAEFSTRLENLTIRNITAENTAHLFGTAWYFPAVYRSRLKNLIIEDSVAINNLAGAFQLFNVDGGHIRRVHSIGGGGQDTWSGTTLGFMQSSQNFTIEDSEFSSIDRAQAADGSGMDFEGDNHNITFRNNVIYNNAGSALLILSTGGPNTNLLIEDNTFYNNARDPWNSEINSEIQGGGSGHTGIFRNNGIYRGDSSINYFSPNADWSGFVRTGNRELEY